MNLSLAGRSTWLALLVLGGSACSDRQSIPSKSEALDGYAITVDVRGSTYEKGSITVDALAKNGEDKQLVGLSVSVSLYAKDGSEEERIELTPVGSLDKIPVLEPGFSAPIHLVKKVSHVPDHLVVHVTAAQKFADAADQPQPLPLYSGEKAAKSSELSFSSFGHFRLDSKGDLNRKPFRATLGIENKGKSTVSKLEYSLVFLDPQEREIDRIPLTRTFEPALAPGDALLEPVTGSVRLFDHFAVEVRSEKP